MLYITPKLISLERNMFIYENLQNYTITLWINNRKNNKHIGLYLFYTEYLSIGRTMMLQFCGALLAHHAVRILSIDKDETV